MDILTPVLILALSVLWGLLYYRPRRKLWAAARLIPGPTPLPLIGNVTAFWISRHYIIHVLFKLRAEFGDILRLWFGSQLVVLLCDCEDIQCVLGNTRITNRDQNFSRALEPFLGNGLILSRDHVWKEHRKLLTPMFHFNVLASYMEIFGAKGKILVDKLDEVADGRTFDIFHRLSLCTLDSICETAIGAASDMQKQGYSDFQKALSEVDELVYRLVVYPWLLNRRLYSLTSDGSRARPVKKVLRDFSSDLISNKTAAYRRGERREGIVTSSGKTVTSFLDMMIEASETNGSILTEREIQDQLNTIAVTGLETTAITMSALLLLIAIHPEWQDALHAEMTTVFADDPTRPATHHDLPKMAVLDRVIRETLRMYPAAVILSRAITEDIRLPSGYLLPEGSSVVIINSLVHRDARNFPEPEKFLPDRWLTDGVTNKHPYAYLPFGAGARNCIGQKYALFQMKAILSQVVRRFRVTTDYTMDDMEKLTMSFVVRLGHEGYRLQLERRETLLKHDAGAAE